jgi:hypothetical protein
VACHRFEIGEWSDASLSAFRNVSQLPTHHPPQSGSKLPHSKGCSLIAMDTALREQFEDALALYNRGDYLDAQEQLEAVYNAAGAEDQPLVRALMMLACGMHLHFNRGGGRGVLNLIRQSLMILDDLRPESHGIATGELYEALEAYLQELQERRKPGAGFFDRWLAPRVRYR